VREYKKISTETIGTFRGCHQSNY